MLVSPGFTEYPLFVFDLVNMINFFNDLVTIWFCQFLPVLSGFSLMFRIIVGFTGFYAIIIIFLLLCRAILSLL